jgi:short-subunit dehydrogenase
LDRAQYGPWAFIAGGSEGVGESFARRLAEAGINLVLAARRAQPLQALADDLRRRHGVEVRTVAVDLCAPDLVSQVRAATDDVEVGFLVYNAGSGNPIDNIDPERPLGDFLDRPLSDARSMISLNVAGLTELAHHFAGPMRARRRGGIIIVGSTACHAGTAHTLVYSASKSFQFAFAEGLWYELRPHNVQVLGLILGAVRTPNVERTGMDMASYTGAAEPDAVVEEAFEQLGVGPIRHAGGTGEFAQVLRSLPRDEAATRAAQGIEAYFPSFAGGGRD